jgi:hypothetical protein
MLCDSFAEVTCELGLHLLRLAGLRFGALREIRIIRRSSDLGGNLFARLALFFVVRLFGIEVDILFIKGLELLLAALVATELLLLCVVEVHQHY